MLHAVWVCQPVESCVGACIRSKTSNARTLCFCLLQAERLQYYEALMLACERLGCPQLAARFAQAAVRQVPLVPAINVEALKSRRAPSSSWSMWMNQHINALNAPCNSAACVIISIWQLPAVDNAERGYDSKVLTKGLFFAAHR